MRISEMLNAIASWLENPDNEAILLSEDDELCMHVVVEACVKAASEIKKAAEIVEDIEPLEPSNITPESIDGLANLACVFDQSGDPELKKQASVIDELLLTISAPKDALQQKLAAEDRRLDELKKKYEQPRQTLHDVNKISESEKAIAKSNMLKTPEVVGGSLSTRYCPSHPGCPMIREAEHTWRCELDNKVYNYETGFELEDGTKVPGGSVDLQTQNCLSDIGHSLFDSREGRLQSNKTASAKHMIKTAYDDLEDESYDPLYESEKQGKIVLEEAKANKIRPSDFEDKLKHYIQLINENLGFGQSVLADLENLGAESFGAWNEFGSYFKGWSPYYIRALVRDIKNMM